jgi:anti-sigma factor RsiW
MSGAHLSEEELQQYILDRPECTSENIAHLDGCPDCQAEVAAYAMLMEGLSRQPTPVFGFDVSAVVMQRLAESPVGERAVGGRIDRAAGVGIEREGEWGTRLVMAALILLITAVPAWLFRKSAYYVFTDFPAIFLYLILAAAGVFLLLSILHLMKRYQHIINIINK